MRNLTVKSPVEENLWWEGDDLYVRDDQDNVWKLSDARLTDCKFASDPRTMEVESVPLTFEKEMST